MVVINKPPPNPKLTLNPQFKILEPDTILRRIYNPHKYNTQATTFRFNGPRARFDHQRCQPADEDPERGINYWGFTLKCCLVEVFGDTRVIDVEDYHLAKISLTQPIKLLNLIGDAAMLAGTLNSVSQIAEHDITQAWGKYFYETTSVYGKVDGLLFKNAHNDERSIALYERAKPKLDSAKVKTMPLASRSLRPAIIEVAQDCSMIFD